MWACQRPWVCESCVWVFSRELQLWLSDGKRCKVAMFREWEILHRLYRCSGNITQTYQSLKCYINVLGPRDVQQDALYGHLSSKHFDLWTLITRIYHKRQLRQLSKHRCFVLVYGSYLCYSWVYLHETNTSTQSKPFFFSTNELRSLFSH